MKIKYIGHSCFKIESNGASIIFDPYEDNNVPGLTPPKEEANLVICSHEHGDHNAKDLIKITDCGKLPFTITKLDTYHDPEKGALRGTNTISIVDDGEVRVAHLGDLGCELTDEQIEALDGVDLMFIPVGGHFTIDADEAAEVVEQCNPQVVIPMHFRGEGYGYDVIASPEDFLDKFSDVVDYDDGFFEITPSTEPQIAFLKPQNIAK